MAGTPIQYDYLKKLFGTLKSEKLTGTAKHDYIFGDNGNDTISGGNGHDMLDGGRGNDKLYGGAGDDTIDGDAVIIWKLTAALAREVAQGKWNDFIDAGDGNDQVDAGIGNDTAYLGAGDDVYINRWAFGPGAYAQHVYQGSDTVYAGSGNDIVEGHKIFGESGNDTLTQFRDPKDTSQSKIDGGTGNDTIYVDYNAKVIGGSGNDKVTIGYSYKMVMKEDFSEPVTKMGSTGKIVVDLGAGNDTLTRVRSGDNDIRGGAGNDIIYTKPLKPADGTPLPKWLGGDDFIFNKGDAKLGGDHIYGFEVGKDDLDFTHYDKNGDGRADLRKSDVKLTFLKNDVTKVEFNHETVTVHGNDHLTWSDLLFA